jgi:MoaA/NifB/PqqE/SkfB family radical SAM enzyme
MRKLAFGYSTQCNIRCEHCVATGDSSGRKMDYDKAKEIIAEMARANVGGISFSGGEPFLYFNEIAELVDLCRKFGIYTRIVTNSFWAKTAEDSDRLVLGLKENGLCQLRLSFSRWQQKNISRSNVLNAARSCQGLGSHLA